MTQLTTMIDGIQFDVDVAEVALSPGLGPQLTVQEVSRSTLGWRRLSARKRPEGGWEAALISRTEPGYVWPENPMHFTRRDTVREALETCATRHHLVSPWEKKP